MDHPGWLSHQSFITWDIIKQYPESSWNWLALFKRFSPGLHDLEQYFLNHNAFIGYLENYPNISEMLDCFQNLDPKVMNTLKKKEHGIYQFIDCLKQNTYHRYWVFLTSNPNFTFSEARKYKQFIILADRQYGSHYIMLEFLKEENKYIDAKKKQYLAVITIEKHWLKAKYNPEYALCRKLQKRSLDELIEKENVN